MELTPTIVNVAVFGVILLSAILAYARGLTREVFTLAIWAGAAYLALQFFPKVEPLVRNVKDMGEWNKWAAVGVTFVAALIVLTIIGATVSSLIANSPLRAIDKGLGFLFGAARGILILAVCWIGYQQIVDEPEYSHAAIKDSKGGQLVSDAAVYLMQWMPDEWPTGLTSAIEDLMGSDDTTTPTTEPLNAPLPANGATDS